MSDKFKKVMTICVRSREYARNGWWEQVHEACWFMQTSTAFVHKSTGECKYIIMFVGDVCPYHEAIRLGKSVFDASLQTTTVHSHQWTGPYK